MSLESARYSEPFKGKDGQWYFHLQAANGEIVMQSEGYTTDEHAQEGIDSAKHAAAEADSGGHLATLELTVSGEDGTRHFVEVVPRTAV
jgi:uncharacterized protein